MPKITTKIYKCQRCGHEREQSTNHYGQTYSLGHYSACPKCPPWAKYPQYGGGTVWEFVREIWAEGVETAQKNLDEAIASNPTFSEFDHSINGASHEVLNAYPKTAWVGLIHENSLKEKPVEIYNFGADFIVPEFDQKLADLICCWRDIKTLQNRVAELGGTWLYWV